jgi:hypothetical protein
MVNKRRTSSEWLELIAEYKASGQKQEEWCKANGVNYNSFVDCMKRIKKAGRSNDQSIFFEQSNRNKIKASESNSQVKSSEKQLAIVQSRDEQYQGWIKIEPRPEEPRRIETVESSHGKPIRIEIGEFSMVADVGFDGETFTRVCKELMSL